VALVEEAGALRVEWSAEEPALELKNGAIVLAAASLKVVLRHCL
jgi:hypothetical protein